MSIKSTLEIEVCLNIESEIESSLLKTKISSYLVRYFSTLPLNHLLVKSEFKSDLCLFENVDFIRICDLQQDCSIKEKGYVNLDLDKINLAFFFYTCVEKEVEENTGKDKEPLLATRVFLPTTSFEGLWENLVFEEDIKSKLLNYMNTALLFGDAGVNSNIISINRVCLLHGPPGTGKTTLAKALAQKMTIRMGEERYPSGGILVEINPNAIFSKFFAESSKLLLKMFNELHSLLDDEDCFVCLLMDEVESLTAARKSAMNGNEPSDAIRVVNCLLTQIDKLKDRGNVLVLATSNITDAIDIAFLDRADIKQFIGDPSLSAVYTILRQSLQELMRTELITPSLPLLSWKSMICHLDAEKPVTSDPAPTLEFSLRLHDLAAIAVGLSGRTLTKISFLAYSRWIQTGGGAKGAAIADFLEALKYVLTEAAEERKKVALELVDDVKMEE